METIHEEIKAKQEKDHDLLVRIDEQLKGVVSDVGEIKTGSSAQLTVLEQTKVSKDEYGKFTSEITVSVKDLEKEVDSLKTSRNMMTGALIIISLIVIPLVVYIFKLSTNVSNIPSSVKDGVESALSDYNIQTK